MGKNTFYDRLGLPRDATPDEIRHAYRDMARRLHPDKNLKPGETELFIDVQEAYDVLIDTKQRNNYDKTLPPESKTLSPLTSSIIYSRNFLSSIPEKQLIYTLLEFKPQVIEYSLPTPPLNISLVLDCSTSMQGIRLDNVKSTAIELIRQLQPNDILSVVKFSDKAEVIIPSRSNFTQKEIETIIQLLHAAGGTEIFQGLEAGFSQIMRYRSKNHINHIILITDGRTYGDENECLGLVDQANLFGIGISALGIGGQWNDSFLDIIASRTGGSSKFISHPNEIKHFLLDKIAKLGHSFAEQITYTYQTSPGINLSYAYRLYPDASPLLTASPLVIGTVPRDSDLSLLFEFLIDEIPATTQHLSLANGFISYDVPGHSSRQNYSERLEISRPVSKESEPGSPPLSIIKALSRLTLYRMQERARSDLQDGKINEATHRLQGLATHLLAQGQLELARSVLSEVDHIRQTQAFSEEGEKRIKYGTRSLLVPVRSEDKQ